MKRGETRYCACGCGKPAAIYRNEEGMNKGWRAYARGHAPNEAVQCRIPSDPISLAYAAGIIDGEGCIYTRVVTYKSTCTYLKLQVAMCSEVVIRWLSREFGGRVYITAPPSARHIERFIWQVQGRRRISSILRALLPYLKEKQKRAELAIQLAEMIETNGYQRLGEEEVAKRMAIAVQIKAFNRDPRSEDFALN